MKNHLLTGLFSLLGFLGVCLAFSTAHADSYPTKPIRFIVYTNPGGLIDVTIRKLAQVLEAEAVTTPVVVENKSGAGGLVAIQHVLRQPADGHTIFAVTSSVVSKAVQSKKSEKLQELGMLVRLVDDYECLIVKRNGKYSSLEDLTRAMKDDSARVLWVGPAVGGTDHLFAVRFWNALDYRGTWIPYKSGSEAIAAILGGHADVYVGNPQDALGREDLQILAVAAPQRLAQFPEVATFEESDLKELTGASLWRGLAVRGDTPDNVRTAITELLRKATAASQWREFVVSSGAQVIFESGKTFEDAVASQIESDSQLLQLLKAG